MSTSMTPQEFFDKFEGLANEIKDITIRQMFPEDALLPYRKGSSSSYYDTIDSASEKAHVDRIKGLERVATALIPTTDQDKKPFSMVVQQSIVAMFQFVKDSRILHLQFQHRREATKAITEFVETLMSLLNEAIARRGDPSLAQMSVDPAFEKLVLALNQAAVHTEESTSYISPFSVALVNMGDMYPQDSYHVELKKSHPY